MKGKLIFILLICSFLVSCVEPNQLEKLGIINTRGVDFSEDDQSTLESTMSIFQFQAQTEEFTKIVSGKGSTIKGTVKDASNESNFKLVSGKLQLDIYGKAVAESGLDPLLDTLRRDATIPDNMFLAISETTAKDIMMTSSEKITTNIGQYLHGLIEEIAQGDHFPKATLQEFMTTANIEGKDPILPVLAFSETDVPRVSSIGIFKDDKLVGNVDINEMELFNLLERTVEARRIEITLPTKPLKDYIVEKYDKKDEEESLHTSYTIEHGKGTISMKKGEPTSFVVDINMDLNLLETTVPVDFYNPKTIEVLEKEISKEIKKRYEKTLQQLQELEADPFGFGMIYRINQKDGKLDRKEWRKIYPDIDVEFKVNANLIRYGIIGK